MTTSLMAASDTVNPVGGTPTAVIARPAALMAPSSTLSSPAAKPSSDGGLSFHDILDVINPLQHIPVIGTLYRAITGDTITPAAKIAGDALYGGLVGLASAIVDSVVQTETGKDIGDHVLDTVLDRDDAPTSPVAATPASSTSAPTSTAATASSTLSATAPVTSATPPASQTDFYSSLQRGGHEKHGVPLSTSIPMPSSSRAQNAISAQSYYQGANTFSATGAPANATAGQPAAPSMPGSSMPGSAMPGLALPNSAPPASPLQSNAPTSLLPAVPSSSMPVGPTADASTGAVPQMMMKALDQYKAMLQQQQMAGAGAVNMMN